MAGDNCSLSRCPSGCGDRWRVLKCLGAGGEGTAFLVEDSTTSKQWVRKSFHSPLPAARLRSLQIYESRIVGGSCPGLPAIELVQDQDRVFGVRYPYTPVHHVHWRLLRSFAQVGQTMIGGFCRMQYHLISQLGTAIWDADPVDLMLARDGHFHWTDFGGAMEIARPARRGKSRGGFEYGFVRLLLGIHGINFKLLADYSRSYTYAGACTYFRHAVLDTVAGQHRWVREIVDTVRGQRASAFLKADFYQQLGEQLPKRVVAPKVVIVCGALLSKAGSIRARRGDSWRKSASRLSNGWARQRPSRDRTDVLPSERLL